MKRRNLHITLLSVLVAAPLMLVSCGGDDPAGPETGPQAPSDITLSDSSFTMDENGGSLSLTVKAPQRPTISSDAKWVSITDGTFKDYSITFGLSVSQNTTTDSRTATLTVKSGSLSKTLSISQSGVDNTPKTITLSPESYYFGENGGSTTFEVTGPAIPEVSGAEDWLSVKVGSFKDFKASVSLTAKPNTSAEGRECTLTVKSGTLTASFKVTQAGAGETIGGNLSTENPIEAAQALFDYLLSVYGKKTVSAIMANVNWNNTEAEKIHTSTGKYPAMNCYDFIHIYVPDGNGWINYSDLSPVTAWHDAGGIVSLMWHFNVPVNKDTKPGTNGSGVTCTPTETTFKASNALVDGTWEHEWFYSQMDKVADVILGLQNKGIAALWRPFHEAAGNATLKSGADWGKAWFWWGADGAETYVKLWKAMFEYFKSKGIRNLIWVWTTQNYNGKSSEYNADDSWYPGDGYVDIVGRDLYGSTAKENVEEFKQIQERFPSKMVSLSECGNSSGEEFDKISSIWNAGAKWSYFMPWYGSNMPDSIWWQDALGNSSVITRDALPSNL